MNDFTLVFPFTILGKERMNTIKVEIERNLAIISFGLPYNYEIELICAELISKKKYKQSWIYIFEFDELDKAIEFIENPVAYLQFKVRILDSNKAESEMHHLLTICNSENKKIKRL